MEKRGPTVFIPRNSRVCSRRVVTIVYISKKELKENNISIVFSCPTSRETLGASKTVTPCSALMILSKMAEFSIALNELWKNRYFICKINLKLAKHLVFSILVRTYKCRLSIIFLYLSVFDLIQEIYLSPVMNQEKRMIA